MKKLLSVLTLLVPLVANAATDYAACIKDNSLLLEFYYAKYIAMIDFEAGGLHRSSSRDLEELAQSFRSHKSYMLALKELVESDPETAAELLDRKMRANEKPFDALSKFEKEHGTLDDEKGAGALVGWTDERQMEIKLCAVKHDVTDLEKEGDAWVRNSIRVCSYLVLIPKKMPKDLGYRYLHRISDGYRIEPMPERKVVSEGKTTILRSIDQHKGYAIMPKDEFMTHHLAKKCGEAPK